MVHAWKNCNIAVGRTQCGQIIFEGEFSNSYLSYIFNWIELSNFSFSVQYKADPKQNMIFFSFLSVNGRKNFKSLCTKGQIKPKAVWGRWRFEQTNLFCLPWTSKNQTKQVRLFVLWENLQRTNLLSELSDLYRTLKPIPL